VHDFDHFAFRLSDAADQWTLRPTLAMFRLSFSDIAKANGSEIATSNRPIEVRSSLNWECGPFPTPNE